MEVKCRGCGRPVEKNHTHDGLCVDCRLDAAVNRPPVENVEGQEELFK